MKYIEAFRDPPVAPWRGCRMRHTFPWEGATRFSRPIATWSVRLLLVCDGRARESMVAAWKAMPEGQRACCIGEVNDRAGTVLLDTAMGGRRLIDLPQGEILPRIC
jgi:hypothetical protein